MSDNSSNDTKRPPSASGSGSGIRLPPISFLGSLNNPRHSPPLGSSQSASQSQQSSQPPSVVQSSQMGLAHLVSSSKTNTPDNAGHSRDNSSGFQLPSLSDSGFNQSRLTPADTDIKQEASDEKRSVYSLPTPVQLGIDVRRQNLSSEVVQQAQPIENHLQAQQQAFQQQREDDESREKRLKEERKRKNKEKRERDKALRQQQQSYYDQQQDVERRKESERAQYQQQRLSEEYQSSVTPPFTQAAQQIPQQQQQSYAKQSYDDTQEEVIPFKKQNTTIDSSSVFEDSKIFPRAHIGTILYQQFPTKSTVIRKLRLNSVHEQRLKEDQFAYQDYLNQNKKNLKNKPAKIINLLPPYLRFYINSLVDIKISYKDILQNENVFKRRVWGTDIYTDDSDIVAILYHCGVIPSKSPFSDKEDEEDSNIEATTPGNLQNPKSIQYPPSFKEFEGDLIVTLLILPGLTHYQGSYRNNYNSRTWMTSHDGGSIAIYNVKWCNIGDAINDNNYADIRKAILRDRALLKHQMLQDEQLAEDKEDAHENKQVKTLLNKWNFDKSYLKATKSAISPVTAVNDDADGNADATVAGDATDVVVHGAEQDDESKRETAGNDTTILANQTTQIQNADDNTILDISKHDDTTIDERA